MPAHETFQKAPNFSFGLLFHGEICVIMSFQCIRNWEVFKSFVEVVVT